MEMKKEINQENTKSEKGEKKREKEKHIERKAFVCLWVFFVPFFKCKILSVNIYQINNEIKFNNANNTLFFISFSRTTASRNKSAMIDLIHENTRIMTEIATISFETKTSLKKEHAWFGTEETTGKKRRRVVFTRWACAATSREESSSRFTTDWV